MRETAFLSRRFIECVLGYNYGKPCRVARNL